MNAPKLMTPNAPAPSEGAIAVLLIGLACRGGAHLLQAPARARLAQIMAAAGVPADVAPAQAQPQLLAYLQGLDVDPKELADLEAAMLQDIDQDKRVARRASRRLLGGTVSRFEARTAQAPTGTLRVTDMAPPRRLR